MSGDVQVRFCERLRVQFPWATHLVIMARFVGQRITRWVERTVEEWLSLTINRKKTRVITLVPESEANLDFLGYTFRYEWGHTDRTRRFLTVIPSAKAVALRKARLREATNGKKCFVPIPELMKTLNQQLQGWANYFSYGFTRWAYRELNTYAINRLTIHLRRRSQRACRPPAGMTYYQFLTRRLGLKLL